MDYIILGLLILNLGAIAFQDFKDRRITILLFVPLGILSFLYPADGLYVVWFQMGLNLVLLLAIYGLTWIYFRLRKSSEDLIGKKIGWGDVLVLLAIIPLFEPIGLILLVEIGAILGMLYFLIFRPGNREIPFAGIVTASILCLTVVNEFTANSLFTDELFSNLMNNV